MIPTTTGAAKAVGLVLPELKGKLDGSSIRVPTPDVSVVDFKFVAKRKTSAEEINGAIKKTADAEARSRASSAHGRTERLERLRRRRPLLDLPSHQSKVIDDNFVRVLSWYDDEWGSSTAWPTRPSRWRS